MMAEERPYPELVKRVHNAVMQTLPPTETEIVQLVMLGREIFFHAEWADMGYVESKTSSSQLDLKRLKAFQWLSNELTRYRANLDNYSYRVDALEIVDVLIGDTFNK